MAVPSWAQQCIEEFFQGYGPLAQTQCDDTALSVTGASSTLPVGIQGSLSYTVVCSDRPEQRDHRIVSIRLPQAQIDGRLVELAQEIHGRLVSEATDYGLMSHLDPPLTIDTMLFLPGISCLGALSHQTKMDPQDEVRHLCYIKHLARYFARCWLKPQPINTEVQAELQEGICRRLSNFRQSCVFSSLSISKLEHSLPMLFSPDYPQVLTHGDFSITNILVDKNTFEITGLVDWSLAAVLPFGVELDTLRLTTRIHGPRRLA